MAGKFDGVLKNLRSGTAAVEVEDASSPRTGRPPSKSSDPSYRPITVILQKTTIRRARRKIEDDDLDLDLSDLLQRLLSEWVGQ